MRKLHVLTTMILTISMVVLLTACVNQTNQSVETIETSDETTITWWSFPVFAKERSEDSIGVYEEKLVHAFETKYPEIHVELKMIDFTTGPEKIEAVLGSDSMPDVLLDAPGRIIDYARRGYLADVSDLYTENFVTDVDNDNLLSACKVNQTPYMYPLSSAPFYMVFNKKMLQDAGAADLVKENFTINDFQTVIQALSKKGYVPGSLYCKDSGGDQGTRAFVANLAGTSILNQDKTAYSISCKKGTDALAFIEDCLLDGTIVDGTMYNGTEDIQNFVNGHSSYSLLWSPGMNKNYGQRLKANQIETVEVPYPTADGKPSLEYLVNGFCVFQNNDARKIEASKKFIDFLCNDSVYGPKNVVQSGAIPVRNSFGSLYDDAKMNEIGKWTKYYSDYYNTVSGFSDMRTYWCEMLKSLIWNKKDPESALADFAELSNPGLKGVE